MKEQRGLPKVATDRRSRAIPRGDSSTRTGRESLASQNESRVEKQQLEVVKEKVTVRHKLHKLLQEKIVKTASRKALNSKHLISSEMKAKSLECKARIQERKEAEKQEALRKIMKVKLMELGKKQADKERLIHLKQKVNQRIEEENEKKKERLESALKIISDSRDAERMIRFQMNVRSYASKSYDYDRSYRLSELSGLLMPPRLVSAADSSMVDQDSSGLWGQNSHATEDGRRVSLKSKARPRYFQRDIIGESFQEVHNQSADKSEDTTHIISTDTHHHKHLDVRTNDIRI